MWHCESVSPNLTEIARAGSVTHFLFFFFHTFPQIVTRRIICGGALWGVTGWFKATCVWRRYYLHSKALTGCDAIRKWCWELAASNVTAPLMVCWSVVICYVLYNLNQSRYLTSASFQTFLFTYSLEGRVGAHTCGMFPQPTTFELETWTFS